MNSLMSERTMGPLMVFLGDVGDARVHGIGIGRQYCGQKCMSMDDEGCYFQARLALMTS